jgi:Bacterial surface proteins containing Ig-like domains
MTRNSKKSISLLMAMILLVNVLIMMKPPVTYAADTNIAPLADVSVSSFYGNDPAYSGAHAVDGRTDTEWASATSSPWIQLNWDGNYLISKIVIYDRADGTNVASGVLTFSNGAQLSVSGIPGNGDAKEVVLDEPIVTNSLKFDIAGNDWNGVGLAEFQVFGTESAGGGTPVQSITVDSNGGIDSITVAGGTLQMNSKALPENATMKDVIWSVCEPDGNTPTSKAEIDQTGRLTAKSDGDVTVVAAAKDGSGVTGNKVIHINQSTQIGNNIAGSAAVAVSTEYDSSTHKGASAIDGAMSTEWASNESTPWIQLTWNEPQTITRIALYDRADGNNAAGRLVFSNGQEVNVAALPNDGLTPRVITLPNPVIATSVKFNIDKGSGGWNVGLKEFEVYGFAGGMKKEVESIGVSGENGQSAINVKKGSLQLTAAVLPVDATDRSVSWAVYEEDGITPTTKAKIDALGKLTANADGTVTAVAKAKDGSNVSGALKVTLTGQDEDSSVGTNRAGDAEVSVSSEYSSSYIGGNAIDGEMGTEWASKETHPWIRMAWTQAQTIHKIIIYDRSDVSNADGGVLIFSNGYKLNVSDIPQNGLAKEIILDNPVVAKWLRFDIASKTNYNSVGLAEIEVYGFDDGVVTPVESLQVSGETGNAIEVKGGSLQMKAEATPSDATDQRVIWSVSEPDGAATVKATINADGLLSATKKQDGEVLVRATAIDGSSVTGEATVTLTNQELNANTPADATVKVDFATDTVKGSPYVFGFNKNPVRAQADVMYPKFADIGMTRERNTVYLDYLFKGICSSLDDWNSNKNGCQDPDNWNWDQFWWVDYAKANDMKISMIFAYAPSFLTYSGNMFGVPKDWDVYEDIVQTVYLRYKDDIDWIEIMNEPDASWFMNLTGSGLTQTEFIKESYYHIAKAIREVDSDVMMGGLSTFEPVTEPITAVMDDPRITPDMVQYGSFHKYSPQAGKTDINIFQDVFASRASIGFDANAPIMITEYNTTAGSYEERGFTSASWLGLQLTGLIKQGYYAADFYAGFPSYQPIYGETDFSDGSVSNFGMYRWDDAAGTGEFLPLGYTFKLLSKTLGLGEGEFQVKQTAANGVDDAFGAVNSEGQYVAFVVNESNEVKNVDVSFDKVDPGSADVSATARMVSGWSDGSVEVPVHVTKTGSDVKVSISLPSHAVAGITLHLNADTSVYPEYAIESAAGGVIPAKPWDYMQLTTDTIQGPLVWKSSIPYVGNVDGAGKFHALAAGTTVVTAESAADPNVSVQVQILVSPADVPLLQVELNKKRIFTTNRDLIQLEATTLMPVEASDKSLAWTSNHPEIASVDQTGRVTIHSEGTAMIRAASTVNPGIYDECMIVILPDGNMLAGLGGNVTVSGEQPGDLGRNAVDGNVGSRWLDSGKEEYWFQADLGEEKAIGRYLLVNAGPFEDWLGSKINTYAWKFQTSTDGQNWTTVDEVNGNMKDIADRKLRSAVTARYIRILISDPQYPGTTPEAIRIYEIMVLPPSSDTPDTGQSNSSGSTGSSSVISTSDGVELKVEPARNTDGSLLASLSDEMIRKALGQLNTTDSNRVINIVVNGSDETADLSVWLSTEMVRLLAQTEGIRFRVTAGNAGLTFDTKALKSIAGALAGNKVLIRLKAAESVTNTKNPSDKSIEFTVQVGGTILSSISGIVEASMKYDLTEGSSRNAVVAYQVDEQGKPILIGGKYDAIKGMLTFKVKSLGIYTVGYNLVTFQDVKNTAWYKDAVDFAAAREIIVGDGNGMFSPGAKLTRVQILVMLMRAYGIEPDEKPIDNFIDSGQTYYTGYLAAAKRLGLVEGYGGNRYAPELAISRQDIAVMVYRILDLLGQQRDDAADQGTTGFQDNNNIAPYAAEAVEWLSQNGIMIGDSDGKFEPDEPTTRAQAAQILYRLLLL